MQEVAVLGVGLHRFGKTGDDIVGNKPVTALCRHAIDAALADAGVRWKDIQAVCAASSRLISSSSTAGRRPRFGATPPPARITGLA